MSRDIIGDAVTLEWATNASESDWAELALACLDQAGMSARGQKTVREMLVNAAQAKINASGGAGALDELEKKTPPKK